MSKYKHITKMEKILDEHREKLNELEISLNFLMKNFDEFKELVEYYYSDQRKKDLEEDEKGLISTDIKRGVLSEDSIYNLMMNYYELSIQMMELSTHYFKNR